MTRRCFYWAAVAALLIPGASLAQDAVPPQLSPPSSPHISIQSIPKPPVPEDSLELVTGEAQPVQDAEQRAAALALLETARNLSNVRAQAYDLKTAFTSMDSSGTSTVWTEEDLSPGHDIYRWTVEGPSYSAIFLNKSNLLFSNQSTNAIPLRVAEMREAIFFQYTWIHDRASIRMATGNLNGLELQCILIAHAQGSRTLSGGRNWDEYEYCIDAKTGLLATYSPVPGIYYHYDFEGALHFHDKIIPAGFTISEAGRIVVEAKTVSVNDPVNATSEIFTGAGLTPLGVGPSTGGAYIEELFFPMGRLTEDPQLKIVVVAGMRANGSLTDPEILASTDAQLDDAALDRINKMSSLRINSQSFGADTASGAVAPSREVIYVIQFVTSGA